MRKKATTMNSKASVGIVTLPTAISGNLVAVAMMMANFHCCFLSIAGVEPLE